MKKHFLILNLLFVSVLSFAQYGSGYNNYNDSFDKTNELKINTLSLLTYGTEIGFEKSMNEGMGIGITAMIPYQNTGSLEFMKTNLNFNISPYMRYYFSPMNSGFFVEGFGMYANRKDPNYSISNTTYSTEPNFSTLGLGIGAGHKIVSYSGFTFEGDAGIGRNLILPQNATLAQNFILKLGVSAGFRF